MTDHLDHRPDTDTADPETAALLADLPETGVSVLRVDEPDDVAIAIADHLGADLVAPGPELREEVRRRLALRKVRAEAEVSLAEMGAADDTHRPLRVLTDTDGLRSLAESLRRAERLTERSAESVRERLNAGVVADLAVHPDTIRRVAEEYQQARQRMAAAETALAEEEAVYADLVAEAKAAMVAEREAELAAKEEEEAAQTITAADLRTRFGSTEGSSLQRVVLVSFVVIFIVFLVIVVIGGSPIAAVALIALGGWGYAELRERRRDVEDRSEALDNLAVVSAIAGQAYGGAEFDYDNDDRALPPGEQDLVEPPASLVHARARQASASNHVARARSDFEALVGPDADPDDVESVLRLRDAQYDITDRQIAVTPTIRAASGFERRLRAEWKVAWAAAGRPAPPLARAEEAIADLERDEIHVLTVERWHQAADIATAPDGRTRDELDAVLAERLRPIVVTGDDLDVERVEATASAVADAVAVVVVTAS